MDHINYLICVYKFCKNVKFTKLKLRKNFPVYGMHVHDSVYQAVISAPGNEASLVGDTLISGSSIHYNVCMGD